MGTGCLAPPYLHCHRSGGCMCLSQCQPRFRDALGFIEAPGWLVASHLAGALPTLLEGVSGLGLHYLPLWLCLTAWWDGVKASHSSGSSLFSALGTAHWLQNKLVVTSAEAGASGAVLPACKRRNSPSSMQEHLSLGGL